MTKKLMTALMALMMPLMTVSVATPAQAANIEDFQGYGPYGFDEYGEFGPELFGSEVMTPSIEFGYVDFVPQTDNPDEKFPFVFFVPGITSDGRYIGETFAKRLTSHGFAVRIIHSGTNLTAQTVSSHMALLSAEYAEGSAPMVQRADFSRTSILGYSAGAGTAFWGAPLPAPAIPGYNLSTVVGMGFTILSQATQPAFPDDVPALILNGEKDLWVMGDASQAAFHGLAANKNQRMVIFNGADHFGALDPQYAGEYFGMTLAWLNASVRDDIGLRDSFRDVDPGLIQPEAVYSYDQTPKAQQWG